MLRLSPSSHPIRDDQSNFITASSPNLISAELCASLVFAVYSLRTVGLEMFQFMLFTSPSPLFTWPVDHRLSKRLHHTGGFPSRQSIHLSIDSYFSSRNGFSEDTAPSVLTINVRLATVLAPLA